MEHGFLPEEPVCKDVAAGMGLWHAEELIWVFFGEC